MGVRVEGSDALVQSGYFRFCLGNAVLDVAPFEMGVKHAHDVDLGEGAHPKQEQSRRQSIAIDFSQSIIDL
jgi:hypothetical protein